MNGMHKNMLHAIKLYVLHSTRQLAVLSSGIVVGKNQVIEFPKSSAVITLFHRN